MCPPQKWCTVGKFLLWNFITLANDTDIRGVLNFLENRVKIQNLDNFEKPPGEIRGGLVKDKKKVLLLVRTNSPDAVWEMALQKGAGADGGPWADTSHQACTAVIETSWDLEARRVQRFFHPTQLGEVSAGALKQFSSCSLQKQQNNSHRPGLFVFRRKKKSRGKWHEGLVIWQTWLWGENEGAEVVSSVKDKIEEMDGRGHTCKM